MDSIFRLSVTYLLAVYAQCFGYVVSIFVKYISAWSYSFRRTSGRPWVRREHVITILARGLLCAYAGALSMGQMPQVR